MAMPGGGGGERGGLRLVRGVGFRPREPGPHRIRFLFTAGRENLRDNFAGPVRGDSNLGTVPGKICGFPAVLSDSSGLHQFHSFVRLTRFRGRMR